MIKAMWHLLALAGLAICLGACAGMAPQKAVLDDFSNRATRGPVYMYWNCSRPEGGLLQIDGVAVQPGFPSPVRDLKLRVEGLDARGAVVSKGEAAANDYVMHQMEQNPFRVTVRTVGTESRFDLTYTYWLHTSGGGNETVGEADDHDYVAKNVCPKR